MEGSIATGAVGEAMHHQVDEPQHKIILLEGLTADATLKLMREKLSQLPQATLDLAMHQPTAFWIYALIILACFYIFHRLTEVRPEENNIWTIASKERQIEAKIAEEEKEEEKQKDKLERHKLRARKQRLLQELHPSIAKKQEEEAKKKVNDLKGLVDSSHNNGKSATSAAEETAKRRPEGSPAEAHHVTWIDSGSGSEASAALSVSQKKRAKNRRRRLARKMAMADSGITDLGS